MTLLKKMLLLFRRKRFDAELEEEMAFHRAQAEREFVAAGMTAEVARYAAMRQFGNRIRMKERSHEVIGFRAETVVHDARYALRQLLANPAFTIVILLTLALAIGANTAIFSVINGVLLKRLPYQQPDRLVRVFLSSSDYPKFPLNPFDFRDFRARNRSFESMAAFNRGDVQLSGSGEPVRLNGFGITSGYFHVLGLHPQLGREFDRAGRDSRQRAADDFQRPAVAYAISAADPNIIGRKITVNTQPFTVIGVMPAGTVHPGNVYHALRVWRECGCVVAVLVCGRSQPARFALYRGHRAVEGERDALRRRKRDMNAIMTQLGHEHPNNDKDWNVLVIPLYNEVVGRAAGCCWCCWERWRWCCSSLARMRPTCCWRGLRRGSARSRCAWPWALRAGV